MKSQSTIWLIDARRSDRARIARGVGRLFEGELRVIDAPSCEEALARGAGEHPDCILIGERAREYSPSALRILARPNGGGWVPVILIADEEKDETATAALEAGAYDVLCRRRVGGPELFRALRNALETSRMRRALESTGVEPELDSVTRLPARRQFTERLAASLSRTGQGPATTAVLLIGVDGFKAITSTFGYDVGDQLLRMLAGRLRHCVRNADTIARWGGDEFVVLLESMSRPDDAIFVAKRIIYAFSRPFVREGQDFYLSASIGIALHTGEDLEGGKLLQHADAAMYRVKRLGGNNYQIYSDQMNLNLSDRLSLANRLRTALKREEFVLYYQPQIDVRAGRVVGLEALLRWNDAIEGLRQPAEFIPILEETGLILPVGEWVLRKACTQARAWEYAGLSGMRVSVNLSPKQFQEKELPRRIEGILRETGLPAGSLEIELTESVLMDDRSDSGTVLARLKEIGSFIALDDFGTGYSSLGFLKTFPVDTLKIDRSFIRDIGEDQDDRAICSAIVNLGQSLKLEVMAEGVETEAQMSVLRDQGCHLVQGFLYAPPMAADDVWQWLTGDACRLSSALPAR
jgi:diguanylate cyclase (GGDEF)-like protein